jgi:hypothetical protein
VSQIAQDWAQKTRQGTNHSLALLRMVTNYFQKNEFDECVQLRSELLCILCTNFVHRRFENDTELIRKGRRAERQEALATVSQVAQDWAQKTHRGRTELGEWGPNRPTWAAAATNSGYGGHAHEVQQLAHRWGIVALNPRCLLAISRNLLATKLWRQRDASSRSSSADLAKPDRSCANAGALDVCLTN